MDSDGDPDCRAIYVALVLTMTPVVVATMVSGEAFSGGSTASLLLAGLGLIGLVQRGRGSPAIPRAQARRSHPRRKG